MVEHWRGTSYTVDLLPKVRIEAVVNDELLEQALDTIEWAARTGEIGDGKVFVLEIADAMRVRTGERGDAAL